MARAKRFDVETKESLEAKRLERMRRFGLDVKKDNEMAASKVEKASLDDEIKAKRLERFG